MACRKSEKYGEKSQIDEEDKAKGHQISWRPMKLLRRDPFEPRSDSALIIGRDRTTIKPPRSGPSRPTNPFSCFLSSALEVEPPWKLDQLEPDRSISVSLAGEEAALQMSHFGRSGPPDIRHLLAPHPQHLLPPAPTPFASVALCVNASRGCFAGTTADDLFPLFDKYGEVVDLFVPRDRRTGESRGFAFVRYKYADEAQKAVDKLDGRVVDGREIGVQFAKYCPYAERIDKGRIAEPVSKIRRRSRSHNPQPRCGLSLLS
ncbi:uncharacterized protein LOC104448094 [Eucalyptus grandis]|uniref:uncharacterized protein LOC104448094 n=1 Tax=Eucalyptus grandis TaxID=71139 RepID=UPI00192F0970|nr:uncharacterized protein LOC104448094 [Eucalyptus grandis]